ncbi:MAG: hypothetical protein NVSMB52_01180 [Chloroflexota bacterium]
MGWDIRIWHEDAGEHTRMSIEAGVNVPDEVISSVVGSYWLEEVQFIEADWDESALDGGASSGSSPHIHG